MLIKIPIVNRTMESTGKPVESMGTLEVEVDTSAYAHLKWEEHFQGTLNYDLTTYTAIVDKRIKENKTDTVSFLSMLKVLYCYVNSDKLPTFKDFTKLFDPKTTPQIIKILTDVFQEVANSSTKNF